jgi:ATP-dependent exoDNAse (exonuclease V) beta subunit
VDSDRLLIGRAVIRLGEPDIPATEHPERWKELRAKLSLEEDAEEKRVVYVGLTRPMNRLILAGIPQGTGVRPSLAQDFLGIFPDLAAARDGDAVRFIGLRGVQHEALVHMATVADETATTDVATPVTLPAEAVTLPQTAIAIPLGLLRHSATELLVFSRCERRHAFKYVHGIREPKSLAQSGRTGISAIAHGQIVHDVLERFEEEAELEHLLEDAIGRWDENAPPPESPVGRSYRVELTREITRVLALPEYASIAGAPGARRELTFLDVLADGAAMQGAIDLAAPLAEGVTLVDVKTSRIRAGEASRKAAEYAPQQDVYVSAAAALGPLPVRRFGFVFSGPGNSVVTEVNDESIAEARNRVRRTVAAMGEVPAQLASNPRECFLCGYRAARMCPGVRAGAPAPVMADARSPDTRPRDG